MRRADPRPDRALLLVAVTLALMLVPATTAAAAGDCQASSVIRGGGGEAGTECSDTDGESTELVGDGGDVTCTEERAADPSAWWISYDIPDEVIPGELGSDTSPRRLDLPEGQTFAVYRDCNGQVRSGLLWVPEPDPGSAADGDGIFEARQQARARVEPSVPVFVVSPEQAVVRFPTWLWLDDGYWQPASASAATTAGVTVTVDATPVQAIWDLDEEVQVCDGPGIPWSPAAEAAYELQPETVRGTGNPACTFTFLNASSTRPSGLFDASVTVVWEFSWSLNGVDRGVFGTVEVTEAFGLRVGEVQAVITG